MRNLEKVLIVCFFIGVLLKALSLVGGNILVFLSLFSLSIFYLLFTFALFNNLTFKQMLKKESYENITALRTIYSILCSFAFYSFIIGLFLKTFNREGEVPFFWSGTIFIVFCLIITLIKYFQNHSTIYKIALIRMGLFALFFILYLFIRFTVGWAHHIAQI
jgi:hypothetical protein